MKEVYYRHINIPFNFDLSSVARFDTDLTELGYTKLSVDLIDNNIVDFFLENNIGISTVASFYTPPGGILAIHIDLDSMNDLCKINFCYGGGASRMYWYTVKPGVDLTPVPGTEGYYGKSNDSVVSHISLKPDQCNYAASAKIGRPTLVKVGKPHGVINVSNEERWNICLTLKDPVDSHVLHFNEVAERLKDFLV
jgi:hypothetical protein